MCLSLKHRIKMDLEKQLQRKQIIAPVVEHAMHELLGLKIEEINQDISSKLVEGKLDYDIDVAIPFKQAKENFKRSFVIRLMQAANGNISDAALTADIDRRHLHRLILKYKINVDYFRKQAKYSEQTEKQEYVKQVIGDTLKKYELTKEKSKYVNEDAAKNIATKMPGLRITLKEGLELFEKEYFRKALEEFSTLAKTAKSLGIRYETLVKKIKRLNL
jgi:DNA-binding NtrC family response regulator